jgi:hypothetical protein
MRTTLSLVTGGADLALAIPKTAVLGEAGSFYAFVRDEDRLELFERRPLVLGVSNDRFVEVIEGLYPGELVVSEGNYSLQYLTPIAEQDEGEPAGAVSAGDGEADSHSDRSPLAVVLGVLSAVAAAAIGIRVVRGRARTAPGVR